MAYKKNVIANYVGQFYLIIIGIVMVPFYVDYLGEEAYGLVTFFALIQSWMLLLDMGISPTLAREVAKVKAKNNITDEFKNLFHSLEVLFISVSFLVALIIAFLSGWISHSWLKVETLDFSDVAYCVLLIGIMVGLRFITSLYKSGVLGTEQQVWFNKANIVIATLKFVGVIFILHYISNDYILFFEYQMLIAIIEIALFAFKFYSIMGIGRFKIFFSYEAVKPILSFAVSIAYTGAMWIAITQLDKLLLSGILPLKEYGFFGMVGMVATAIIQLSEPVSKAILPRMTNLHTLKKDDELIALYKKSTQIVSIIIFSVVGVVSIYSYELLYAWTGKPEIAAWGDNVLFWYAIANGILALSTFQYYIQFAYGELKMHVQYHTIAALLVPPFIIWSAYSFGAIGVAITWFLFMLISFIVWTPLVHKSFIPGVHKNWILRDISPIFISTVVYFFILHYWDIHFGENRYINLMLLMLIGAGVLMVNTLISSVAREFIVNKMRRNNA